MGLFGLVVSLLAAYPRRPRQLALVVLALFASYAVWIALSALWAESTTRVWLETGRTFTYVLIFALALVYLADRGARRVFRYFLMAAALMLLLACVWKLWSTSDISGLFIGNRLSYPVSYTNNAAALFLVAFWPLMWLAASPEERAPVRGIALGLATGLLGLAIMTQSRGAVWSLAISLVLMFVVSPARLRTLLYLIVPALLMVYEFPSLNRYWLESPSAVGGGLAARTLVVASITAGFIGMIVALLERWVHVSRRMKAIFGTVVLLGALAAIVYGSIALTSDVGGPFKWVSQTWTQFTSGPGPGDSSNPGADSPSRLTIVSSSGRVDIWRVAWTEFKDNPVLGVGADNFVFGYDLLRSSEGARVKQPHSLGLQILAETGVVGGALALGAILLALGGLLWPRCVAGWRGVRENWPRRRRDAEGPGASPRFCQPRWGEDSSVYGWEMSLLVAVAYWFVHGSVDWLWQMAGVTIPALLMLAAALSGIDAHVDVMWPRWNRWLRIRPAAARTEGPPLANLPAAPASPQSPEDHRSNTESLLLVARRSDQYAAKIKRRERRELRKSAKTGLMQPPGLLSQSFRALLVTTSLIVIVVAGLPYLSLRYQDSAFALAQTDGLRAVSRAGAARWLQPADPGPYLTQATIYTSAAEAALTSANPGRAGAVLDDLSLSISALDQAIKAEPADWAIRYRAGVAALNLLLATEYANGRAPNLDYAAAIPRVPGLLDWSALAGAERDLPEPGTARGSLAATPVAARTAANYRAMSLTKLGELSLGYLAAAKERNPLASEVTEAMKMAQ